MNFACISVWPQFELQVDFTFYLVHLGMSHYIVSVKDFRQESFCFLLSCISKIIYPRSVITLPFNSDGRVSLAEIPCWSFLECINYFSFELVGVFRIFQFVLVLVG